MPDATHAGDGPAGRVTLEAVRRQLELLLQGLHGRALTIEQADEAYTDGEILYLPGEMSLLPERESNIALYKAAAVHLWAQIRFGTWEVPRFLRSSRSGFDANHFWRLADWDAVGMSREPGAFVEPGRLVAVFHGLETLRLNACIARELPGLGRLLKSLWRGLGEARETEGWREAQASLTRPDASVADSYTRLARLYPLPPPERQPYQGTLHPERVERARERRVRYDGKAAGSRLVEGEATPSVNAAADSEQPGTRSRDRNDTAAEADRPQWTSDSDDQLAAEGRALQLTGSATQNPGEEPQRYQHGTHDGERTGWYQWSPDSRQTVLGATAEAGAAVACRYPEWDYLRQRYHPDWCTLRELELKPGDPEFATRTRDKYRALMKELRTIFARLRDEERLMRRQRDGDDIDIDAVVESWPDRLRGEESPQGLYVKRHKLERDIAVLFLVDMSGSTEGWVNGVERESLILLCEALQALDDRYAIYGFTGMTRQRCEIYRIKTFDQVYDAATERRISGIVAGEYTRMGVAIRHLSGMLAGVDARIRLLVTLSDGKPDDIDGYGGRHGIEDTRCALTEALEMGLHTYCITLDSEARDYLPRLYGSNHYTVVDDVAVLPRRLLDIYRRITS